MHSTLCASHCVQTAWWALLATAWLTRVGGAYTDGLVGWFDYSTYDAASRTWTDKSSAGANASGSTGVAAATDAAGAAGNSCAVNYVGGSDQDTVMFSPVLTSLPLSICTVGRPRGIG